MTNLYELVGLFASAFLSATILPGTSEAALIAILTFGATSVWTALGVATVGNVLGAMLNWCIGFFFASYRNHPRFPVKPEQFEKYSVWFQKWGVWSLFLSWLPLVGDALTIIAGTMRCNPLLVAAIVFIAKGGRYAVVAATTLAII